MSDSALHQASSRPTLSAAIGDPALQSGDAPINAQVRVAVALHADEQARLQATLEQLVGRPVVLDVQQDAGILGGVWVRMGDMVIDGTLKARLEELDELLCAQCHLLLVAEDAPARNRP
jgi:hypothetical protein